MKVMSARNTALVVLDRTGPEAEAALALARAAELLCLVAQPAGTARGGETMNERIFTLHSDRAFHGSELDLLLRSNAIATVLLVERSLGALMLDAGEALMRGYRPVLLLPKAEISEAEKLARLLFADRAPLCCTLDALADQLAADPSRERSWQKHIKATTLLPTLQERLDPAHTAFVLIDVQNDFCRLKRGDAETFSIVDAALPNIKMLLAGARASGCMIVHIQAEYGPMFRAPGHPYRYPGAKPSEVVWTASASEFGVNGPPLPDDEVEVCLPGSWGEQFTEVDVQPGEIVLRKHRYSAFVDTGLEVMLRQRGIRTVVLVGFATNVCVESTARDASMRDFYVVVAEDGVGTRDSARARHENALAEIAGCFGIVVPARRILDVWSSDKRMETAA